MTKASKLTISKVENIKEESLDLILQPSTSAKIQGKILLGYQTFENKKFVDISQCFAFTS